MSAPVSHATVGGLWRAVVLIAFGALLGLAMFAAAQTATARADTTIHVTTTADESAVDGQCSLVEALDIKAGFNEPDCSTLPVSGTATIVVPAGCYRISAAVPFPELGGAEVIEGAGPGRADCGAVGTVIQQQAPTQVLFIDSGADTTVSGLTLTGGHPVCRSAVDPFCNGGGVFNAGRALTLRDVLVTGNSAGSALDAFTGGRGGGGIYNFKGSATTVQDSTITANSAGNGAPGGSAALAMAVRAAGSSMTADRSGLSTRRSALTRPVRAQTEETSSTRSTERTAEAAAGSPTCPARRLRSSAPRSAPTTPATAARAARGTPEATARAAAAAAGSSTSVS